MTAAGYLLETSVIQITESASVTLSNVESNHKMGLKMQ